MTDKTTLAQTLGALQDPDVRDVALGVVASAIFLILLKIGGVFRRTKEVLYRRKAYRAYLETIKKDCSGLIVIGRRERFPIDSVFVNLDIMRSSLSPSKDESSEPIDPWQQRSFVLVGGPGAGKSTMTKRWVLDGIKQQSWMFPIFIRLRDYSGSKSIEDYVAEKIDPKKGEFWKDRLIGYLLDGSVLCVLDGLDEVRPTNRDQICTRINELYGKYFSTGSKRRLIVSCRKEAYRDLPLNMKTILEVRPLTDSQIQRFANRWPPGFPQGKSPSRFWAELASVPRILELARSPLLLVGGLVQYTESNLGIPEERVQYLQRVARWLIEEWATAQGHPPDPHRPLYDRLLPLLAFEMHSRELSEIPIADVHELFRERLPSFGSSATESEDILDDISKKTGVLVREAGGMIVFAQFGLHEYFASLQASDLLSPLELAAKAQEPWWREVILLTVAQQRDPSHYLRELFSSNVILAIAAVAECPTPPLNLVERAIDEGLAAVDSGEAAVSTAFIPLLRKLHGEAEASTLVKLETRLSRSNSSAVVAAEILAVVGTDLASSVLLRHPELWEKTLTSAGHLSENFENVLINWIFSADSVEYQRAAKLVCEKASLEKIFSIAQRLSELDDDRASEVAERVILRFLAPDESTFPDRETTALVVSSAAKAAARLRQPKALLSLVREEAERLGYPRSREYALGGRWMTFGSAGGVNAFFGAVINCISLAAFTPAISAQMLVRSVSGQINYQVRSPLIATSLSSLLAVVAASLPSVRLRMATLLLASMLLIFFKMRILIPQRLYNQPFLFSATHGITSFVWPFMLGTAVTCSFLLPFVYQSNVLAPDRFAIQTSLFSIVALLILFTGLTDFSSFYGLSAPKMRMFSSELGLLRSWTMDIFSTGWPAAILAFAALALGIAQAILARPLSAWGAGWAVITIAALCGYGISFLSSRRGVAEILRAEQSQEGDSDTSHQD